MDLFEILFELMIEVMLDEFILYAVDY